ncbi:Alpha-1,3-mannosyltransferase CMT1 [Tetrabaena socialis]|uniref:Alpha-1,3-mannosyltransferase CMT1 n=1 Tax=Tetrabaena socialis TaxID=47790 RepID=A0A2J8A8J2_9CHLO|nr:Alpha-1,3-mannosyltransferase CMT1 [Tetrabaena socialis]|eukprot:PNH08825.1 Alpha-1,3-mannosyltransferase CMT1 [Tetrabaena socialis]
MSFCGDSSHPFVVTDRCIEDLLVGVSGQHCGFREVRAAASQGSWLALKGKSVFVAVTFHNNQDILPTFFFELLKVILTLREAFEGTVFVSVYESGSTDLSAFELIQLQLLLERLGVEHEVVTRGITRSEQEHRIRFLAKVRNLSLKPLLVSNRTFDTVLFFNDVYFCAQSALDLLLLREGGADMACSADFNRNDQGELAYYDIWASRDLHGRKFRNAPPYIGLPESWQRFQARAPVPVFACWGGMAAVTATTFTTHGLRFRRNYDTECAASECELLCRDMWAVDLNKIVLLPTAIAAYTHDVFVSAQQKYSRPSEPLLELPATVQRPMSVECCPLEDDCESIVDFSSCVEDNVTTVYVEHRNYGSWVPKRHVDGVETAFHYLPANRPMLTGEWFYAADLSHLSIGDPTWSSSTSVMSLGRRQHGHNPTFFVWLSPPGDVGVSCLQIVKGTGPRDPNNTSVWKVCWDSDSEGDVTYLWLHPDGALNVYTASRSWCACEEPSPPRSLWSSASGRDGQASVLLLSNDGVLSVFQFASGHALHRAVASMGLDAVSAQLSKWSMVIDARGSCEGGHLLSRVGRETVKSLEEAIRACEQEDMCVAFTYAFSTAQDARNGLWMCSAALVWHPTPHWVTVRRDLPAAASSSSASACYIAHVDASCDRAINEWEKALLRMRFC